MSSETSRRRSREPQIALLTGGGDRPYALGLAASLIAEGVTFDFIGSDDLEAAELRESPFVRFLNLRGNQRPDASLAIKISRVAIYYARLLLYAATAKPRVFHILWNNKLELLDRTLVLLYYKLLRKRLVLTVHNVNVRQRDGNDSLVNRTTLWFQYWLVDHLFVHTSRMKEALRTEFRVRDDKVSVIPFGINSTVPDTALTCAEARKRFGFRDREKVILFFGNIAAYKGLEYLVEAMPSILANVPKCRLIIAGRPKGAESYWEFIRSRIEALNLEPVIIQRIEYVPDGDTEIYFKAADVLVLPYTHIFQSGVLFLGYNFGLPVIATDIASLRDDIVEGETGFLCEPQDPAQLAEAIQHYFASDLYQRLEILRAGIKRFAAARYSWAIVASVTTRVYERLQSPHTDGRPSMSEPTNDIAPAHDGKD